MFYIINRFRKNTTNELKISFLFLFVLLFCFISFEMDIVNKEISDILFDRMGINVIVYGDINSIDGHSENVSSYEKTMKIFQEMKEDLKMISGNKALFETYLQCSRIYSGENVWDEDLYRIIYMDTSSDKVLQSADQRPLNFPLNYENNEHYSSALQLSRLDPNRTETSSFGYWQLNPLLIGVDDPVFSDLQLDFLKIKEGRTFTEEEINENEKVVIVNQYTFLLERDGIRPVMVDDIIPISIEVNGQIKTYYYKVIGINDGSDAGGIYTVSSEGLNYNGETWMLNNNYHNVFYLPEKGVQEIKETLFEMCLENDVELTKTSYVDNDPEYVYYSQYGGYRPIVISLTDPDRMDPIIDYLSDRINELNCVSSRTIPYTYYTNLDRYIPIIGMVKTNERLFHFLVFVSLISSVIIVFSLLINDLELSKKEIGIMIAMGETRIKIILEKAAEYLLLSIVPIVLSFFASNALADRYIKRINNSILDVDITGSILNFDTNGIHAERNLSGQLLVIMLFVLILFAACLYGYSHLKAMKISRILLDDDYNY